MRRKILRAGGTVIVDLQEGPKQFAFAATRTAAAKAAP
jgi:hypothetical protein